MLAGDIAENKSHPDSTRDVWEIGLWDPTPIALRMFCLLSPGHVLVYWLFLPTAISDPRPSTTVATTIILVILLSAQLLLLCANFSQQSKDSSVIHKEVMNEYDTKFVHPRTQPLVRDVGTQFSSHKYSYGDLPSYGGQEDFVDTYTPTFVINRGFSTRPNPNYTNYVGAEGASSHPISSTGGSSRTPGPYQTPLHLRDMSSPLRPQTAIRQPQFRSTSTGDGGSLGVYTYANSPLRKSASGSLTRLAGQRERSLSPQKRAQKREGNPLTRGSLAPLANGYGARHMKAAQPRREGGTF